MLILSYVSLDLWPRQFKIKCVNKSPWNITEKKGIQNIDDDHTIHA